MKGTVKEITGQETGFWIWYVWAKDGKMLNMTCVIQTDLTQRNFNTRRLWSCNKRAIKKIENVFAWLIQENWIQLNGDAVVRNYGPDIGSDVTMEALNRPGILYDFGGMRFLAPEGWD
jgi:hypothetical protein